jgi:hypothetical protein
MIMTNRLLILFSALLLAQLPARSQSDSVSMPIDESTKLITYKEVVQEPGTPQELFNRAVLWINSYYNNPSDVTKVRDPQTGEIKGVHRFRIENKDEKTGLVTDAGTIQYNFTIEFKEGRYRYTLTEFILKQSSRIPIEKWMNKKDQQYTPQWDDYLRQVDAFAQSWAASLKKGMKPEIKKTDEW